jgi:hypothetical protein
MIKVVEVASQNMVLYTGSKDVIDQDIFSILDWYTSEYGIDAMYDMLLAHSHKQIIEAKESNSCTKQ